MKSLLIGILILWSSSVYASTLKWDAPPGQVTGYRVSISMDGGAVKVIETTENILYLDALALSTGTYQISVQAYNGAGISMDSETVEYAKTGYVSPRHIVRARFGANIKMISGD